MGYCSPDIVNQYLWSVRGQRRCKIFILWVTLTSFVTSTGAQASTLQTSPPCGGTLFDSGNIQSPNYPLSYPNNARCSWRLLAKSNDTGIRIQFNDFILGYSDYVIVYDERNISKRYTGYIYLLTLFAGREARIEFYSAAYYTMRGFTAEFLSINVTNQNQCMTSDMFWCTTEKKCISSNWRCDGYQDCTFREDESLCPLTTAKATAKATASTTLSPESDCQRLGSFWCSRSFKCVPASFRCNNVKDCVNNEDEINCTIGTANITGLAVGGICGVILLIFITYRIKRYIRKRRMRSSNQIPSSSLRTAATPSSTVGSTPATTASHVGAPSMQHGGPVEADNLPMDQLAPPSYEAAMKAYAAGEYANPSNQYGEAHRSSEPHKFTATLVK